MQADGSRVSILNLTSTNHALFGESFAQPIQGGRLLFKEINPLFSYNGK